MNMCINKSWYKISLNHGNNQQIQNVDIVVGHDFPDVVDCGGVLFDQ